MTEEMKRCPFCDGEAHIESTQYMGEYLYRTGCSKSKCRGRTNGNSWKSKQEAIDAWNTRAECEKERDEWKAKAEEYRLRVADHECELVRNEGECRCFTIPPKTCVRDGRMCQEVLKAVDVDD